MRYFLLQCMKVGMKLLVRFRLKSNQEHSAFHCTLCPWDLHKYTYVTYSPWGRPKAGKRTWGKLGLQALLTVWTSHNGTIIIFQVYQCSQIPKRMKRLRLQNNFLHAITMITWSFPRVIRFAPALSHPKSQSQQHNKNRIFPTWLPPSCHTTAPSS